MTRFKDHYGKGFITVTELAKIVADLVDDVAALQTASVNHQHTENTGATYAQNATVAKTATTVALKSSKAPY
jgi:hypothetical protein